MRESPSGRGRRLASERKREFAEMALAERYRAVVSENAILQRRIRDLDRYCAVLAARIVELQHDRERNR